MNNQKKSGKKLENYLDTLRANLPKVKKSLESRYPRPRAGHYARFMALPPRFQLNYKLSDSSPTTGRGILLKLIKQEYNVESLAVFGSYVHQNQDGDSDLDLLVKFDETPTLFQFIRLENHLTELLGVKVDLVMKDALKARIGKRVLAEAQQL